METDAGCDWSDEVLAMKAAERRERKMKKALRELSDTVTVSLAELELAMKMPSTVERGQKIASICNWLDMANDAVRYYQFGVDWRKDNKERALRESRKRLSR